MKQRETIKKQCTKPEITINIINSKAVKVQKTVEKCTGDGVTINFKKTAGDDSEAPESDDSAKSD